jgi:Fic family protein
MGRMWQTLLLYQENQVFAWLPVETIVAHRQEEYYRAIRRSTHHNDSGIFAQFMLTALKDAAIEFRDKYLKGEVETENGTVIDTAIGTATDTVNSLLLQLISHNPGITIDEMTAAVNKSRRTVIRRISKLKEQGIIERLGSDKSGVWKIIGK